MTERSIFATSPPLSPSFTITVPDPDLEIRGGGQSSGPLERGGRSPKKFFLPFGPQFGIKIWGGGGGAFLLSPVLLSDIQRWQSWHYKHK